jgi:hypothetical protein
MDELSIPTARVQKTIVLNTIMIIGSITNSLVAFGFIFAFGTLAQRYYSEARRN